MYKFQPGVSPLRRIMLARGVNMRELAVYSGCGYETIRKICKMDKTNIGSVSLRSLLKIAVCLEIAPVDIIPFLGITPKKANSGGVNVRAHTLGGGGRPRQSKVPLLPEESEPQ